MSNDEVVDGLADELEEYEKVGVGYTRVSQLSDTSIQKQMQLIKAYAERNNIKLKKIYNDGEQASGWDESRSAYQQMLDDAKAGKFECLVVKKGDRLGRDKKERLRTFLNLSDWGVEFHTVRQGYVDTEEPTDFLGEVFRATTDDHTKRREVEEAKAEVKDRLEQGYHQGRPGLGLQFDDQGQYLVPDYDDDFDDVTYILDNHEDKSMRELSNETGIPVSTVHRIVHRLDTYMEAKRRAIESDNK